MVYSLKTGTLEKNEANTFSEKRLGSGPAHKTWRYWKAKQGGDNVPMLMMIMMIKVDFNPLSNAFSRCNRLSYRSHTFPVGGGLPQVLFPSFLVSKLRTKQI